MAFIQVQCFSDVLDITTSVNVIMPEAKQEIGAGEARDASLPKVLYLLHGYNGDHSSWMRRSSIERYAAAHNLAVVMPAVQNSYYCNEAYGWRFWDYVSDELPRTMAHFFRLSSRPEDTYVAGLSMGGYGAMRLALTYPDRFAAAGSFSGAVNMIREIGGAAPERQTLWRRVLGDPAAARDTDVDLMYLMKKNASAPKKPRLYVSCGTADFLYGQHQAFVPALRDCGWDVTSFEKPGVSHEWAFWDEQVKIFIDWIMTEEQA